MMNVRALNLINGCRRSLLSLNSISSSFSILCRRNHDSSNAYAPQNQTQTIPSSSSPSASPFVTKILRILHNEIQYQYDYAPTHEPPTEIDKFTVEDRPGEVWITIRGESAEDENIKIEATMFDGSIYDTEQTMQRHISMLVDIWKEGRTDRIEFVCSAWPHWLEIQKVYIFRRDNPPGLPYMGPDFKNLSNKLQTEFYEFLNARGVNDDLSKSLHLYMMNKDRIELIQWMRKVQSYFEK